MSWEQPGISWLTIIDCGFPTFLILFIMQQRYLSHFHWGFEASWQESNQNPILVFYRLNIVIMLGGCETEWSSLTSDIRNKLQMETDLQGCWMRSWSHQQGSWIASAGKPGFSSTEMRNPSRSQPPPPQPYGHQVAAVVRSQVYSSGLRRLEQRDYHDRRDKHPLDCGGPMPSGDVLCH